MLNENYERVLQLDGDKPIELMTTDERDAHFLSFSGMRYDEWCEYYKDDTTDVIISDMFQNAKFWS